MARYGKKAQQKVREAMHETRHSAERPVGKKATSRKPAIASGLSKARKTGAKVPPKKGGSKKKDTFCSGGPRSASATARSLRKMTADNPDFRGRRRS